MVWTEVSTCPSKKTSHKASIGPAALAMSLAPCVNAMNDAVITDRMWHRFSSSESYLNALVYGVGRVGGG